jgi:proteasome lid subunit RPN8/RPN11
MKDIVIPKRVYNRMAGFSKQNPKKEACAFIFGKKSKNSFIVQKVIQVRNIKRIGTSFAISIGDFDLYYSNRLLIGLYHSHLKDSQISRKDKSIFLRHNKIKFQIIGTLGNYLNLKCYSTDSNIVNFKIL